MSIKHHCLSCHRRAPPQAQALAPPRTQTYLYQATSSAAMLHPLKVFSTGGAFYIGLTELVGLSTSCFYIKKKQKKHQPVYTWVRHSSSSLSDVEGLPSLFSPPSLERPQSLKDINIVNNLNQSARPTNDWNIPVKSAMPVPEYDTWQDNSPLKLQPQQPGKQLKEQYFWPVVA